MATWDLSPETTLHVSDDVLDIPSSFGQHRQFLVFEVLRAALTSNLSTFGRCCQLLATSHKVCGCHKGISQARHGILHFFSSSTAGSDGRWCKAQSSSASVGLAENRQLEMLGAR